MNIVNVARERKTNQNASIGRLNRANFPKSELFSKKSVGKPRFDPLGIEPARQEVCQPTPSNSVPSPPFLCDSGSVPSPQPGLEIFFLFVLDTPFLKWYNPGRLGARGGAFFSFSPISFYSSNKSK
jgi:hypothetical protein